MTQQGHLPGVTRTSPSGLVDLSGRVGRIVRSVKGVCTWCGTIVEKPRRTWCSGGCVNDFWLTQPGLQRTHLFKRDRGVCDSCGLDTERLEYLHARLRSLLCRWHRLSPFMRDSSRRAWEVIGRSVPPNRHSLWDLEHTVAIADGGDPHDPSNWTTMCVWCHKAKSKREAGERARRKRDATSGQTSIGVTP